MTRHQIHSNLDPAGPQPTPGIDLTLSMVKRFLIGLFSEDPDEPKKATASRVFMGALGGLFYAILKNFFSGRIGLFRLFSMAPGDDKTELLFGYCGGFAMSIFVGGVVAWLAGQRSKRMSFLMGSFGTALVISLWPGLQMHSEGKVAIGSFVSRAFAADDEKCIGPSAFDKGFKAFFGVSEKHDRAAVVVASGKSASDAQAKLKRLSGEDPSLQLRTGPRACSSGYYPVYASEYLPPTEAKAILEKAKRIAPDAYLSPGPIDPE